MTTYFQVNYDNENNGPYVELSTTFVTWTGGTGFLITLVDDGVVGKLVMALISGIIPTDGLIMTQGGVTADADGNGKTLLYPAYFRRDITIPANGVCFWNGPALGATHSFLWDGQTTNVIAGEILTFSGDQQCEVITIVSDVGVSGEFDVRWITNTNTTFPEDNDTFIGDIAGDGTLNGLVHDRVYIPLHAHRLLGDLNDDETYSGDDVLSRIKPTPSNKLTNEAIEFLSNIVFNDTIIQHMYGGSIDQVNGDTRYSGLNIKVVSPLESTRPVLIVNDAIVTDYWNNAYMPDSIEGNIRIMIKVREDGVDIDGGRVKGKLLEFGERYFESGITLGLGTTSLTLVSSGDENNNTPVGTVASAPYNTVVLTEGFQTLDHGEGSGLTPFGLELDFGSASSLEAYERTKYIQRRGTAETLFAHDASLFTGIDLSFSYDLGFNDFEENMIVIWGLEVIYGGKAGNPFLDNEVINFIGTGAKGRVIFIDVFETLLVLDFDMSIMPLSSDTIIGVTSGGTANLVFIREHSAGIGLLVAANVNTPTGDLYLQHLTGVIPVDNQRVYSLTTSDLAAASVIGNSISTRTINNQFIGLYTGSNYQTNFGISVAVDDAIHDDGLVNLENVIINPPDIQFGIVTGFVDNDSMTAYPWDGLTFDEIGDPLPTFNEMTLAVALTASVSTVVNVGTGNIPGNTPQNASLRIQRDSDNQVIAVHYFSHNNNDEFQLIGTSPITASISNTVMRAPIDRLGLLPSESFSAIYSGIPEQFIIKVTRGGVAPIKFIILTPTFGANGFNVDVSSLRITDV